MLSQSPPALVEWFRLALLKLEHARGLAHDDLKHRILNRLADLEVELALILSLTPERVAIADAGECPALMPPLSFSELQALEEEVEATPRHKLD